MFRGALNLDASNTTNHGCSFATLNYCHWLGIQCSSSAEKHLLVKSITIGSAADFEKSVAAQGRLLGAVKFAGGSMPAKTGKVTFLPELVREGYVHPLVNKTQDLLLRRREVAACWWYRRKAQGTIWLCCRTRVVSVFVVDGTMWFSSPHVRVGAGRCHPCRAS
jgi:hypothetical protein